MLVEFCKFILIFISAEGTTHSHDCVFVVLNDINHIPNVVVKTVSCEQSSFLPFPTMYICIILLCKQFLRSMRSI